MRPTAKRATSAARRRPRPPRRRAPVPLTPAATHIRFIRHGEIAEAHRNTFYGGAEVPLSERGLAQSLELAVQLAADRPDAVFTSPLSRARLLAERVAELADVPLSAVEELRELDRGDWTFLPGAMIESRWPGAIERYRIDPERGNAPGGETESQLYDRVWGAVVRMVADWPGARLVAVTHGHVIRVIMRRLQGWSGPESMDRFVPYFGQVETRVRPDGSGEILSAPEPVTPEALRGSAAS